MTDLTSSVSVTRVIGAVALAALAVTARAESSGRALMRFPTLYGNTVVFVAHENLWSVPRTGVTPARLPADPGRDVMPRFSPDGRWLAFTGEYQGNREVYVMPAGGGKVQRLTFTSDIE